MYGYFVERKMMGEFPYTDLAVERRRADTNLLGVHYTKENCPSGSWERLRISTKSAAESIGRPIGSYNTLNLNRMDMLDSAEIEDAKDEIAKELCQMLDQSDIFPERIVVAGLGNRNLTPDSIGARCADAVKPTMHIKNFDIQMFESLNCAEIAVCTPGVASTSGLDAAVMLRGICDIIKPNAVIAIDALASRSATRLGRTIQICNTGIAPGSGIGNPRVSLGEETLGVPVIAIGVPTVIDSRLLCPDCTNNDYPFGKANEAMFVSPKEIDDIIKSCAEIIGNGINMAFGIFV